MDRPLRGWPFRSLLRTLAAAIDGSIACVVGAHVQSSVTYLVIRLLDGTRRVIQLMARKKCDFYNTCTLLTIDWINRAAEAARRLEHSAARAHDLSKRFLRRFWVTVTPRVRLLWIILLFTWQPPS